MGESQKKERINRERGTEGENGREKARRHSVYVIRGDRMAVGVVSCLD